MSQPSHYIIGTVRKLPAKYANILIPLILSCLMSGIISFVNLFHHAGLFSGFFTTWLSAWGFSWLVAFPSVLFLLPLVRKISALFVDFTRV